MAVIKFNGCGAVKTKELRKLRRMGRIAARKMSKVSVNVVMLRVKMIFRWNEVICDDGEIVAVGLSCFTIEGGLWEEKPFVENNVFKWAEIKRQSVPTPRLTQEEWVTGDWVEIK